MGPRQSFLIKHTVAALQQTYKKTFLKQYPSADFLFASTSNRNFSDTKSMMKITFNGKIFMK